MNKLAPLAIVVWMGLAAFSSFGEEPPPWQIEGEATYTPATHEVVGTNGVVIRVHGVSLSADRVAGNQESGEVRAEGRVIIMGKGRLWEGTNVLYNFNTGEIRAADFKAGISPFFLQGQGLRRIGTNEAYSAANGMMTTDDYSDPLYRIRAKILIVTANSIEAYGATILVGPVPVFYLPHYHRTLGRHENNYVATPGYEGSFGPYLLNTLNTHVSESVDMALHADWRERRGFGEGGDITYHAGKFGSGTLETYYAHDDNPDIDAIIKPLPHDRKRLFFVHMAEPATNVEVKVVARYEGDPQIIRDFFENEYRTNVQPSSYAEAAKLWPNYTLDVMAQPRLVDFFETVERLPDVKLSAARQQIGATPFYYEGENSVGYFQREFPKTNGIPSYAAARADSFHQIVLPQTYFGFLNVAPRVGARATYYSDTVGTVADTNAQTRGVFNTGMEVSTKLSRTWQGEESDFWDINGLRHIIEPDFNYVYVPTPNRRPDQLPQFDYETPSMRLLPIDFPDYNDIDSIDSQNVLRLALRNKLQTKRRDRVEDFINWALYTDWRLDPRDDQTRFSEVYSDLDFKPREWMELNSQIRWDVDDRRFSESYHRLLLRPNTTWSFSVSHRYLYDTTPDYGHDTITTSLYYRLNENWGFRTSQRYEARDGVFEEHNYTIYRDLRSWTSALTLRFRNNSAGEKNDVTVAVTFSLKAFPRFTLGSDSVAPSELTGQ